MTVRQTEAAQQNAHKVNNGSGKITNKKWTRGKKKRSLFSGTQITRDMGQKALIPVAALVTLVWEETEASVVSRRELIFLNRMPSDAQNTHKIILFAWERDES